MISFARQMEAKLLVGVLAADLDASCNRRVPGIEKFTAENEASQRKAGETLQVNDLWLWCCIVQC